MSPSQTLETTSLQDNVSSKNWSIKNISEVDIVIIAAYAADDAIEQLYEQSLRDLKTTDGLLFIKATTDGTVSAETSANANPLQSLIIARADNLFPVKVIENAADLETDTIVVTGVDVESMKLAEKFQQVISAFPSSELAQGFADAVTAKEPAKTEAFFKASTDYQSLTLGMVVAVGTYYKIYPFIWSGYKDKYYHVHTSDGTTTTFKGAIQLVNQCAAPVSSEKSLPGFNILFLNLNDITKSIALYYSNGCFTDDINSDTPSICLQGVFTQKSNITQDENDTNIISVLRGTIDGVDVLGYDVPEDKQDDPSFLDSILNPQGVKGWLMLSAIIMGGTFLLVVLCKVAYMIEKAIKKTGQEAYLKEFEKENQEFLEKQKTLMQTDERYLKRLKLYEQSRLPESFKSYAEYLNDSFIAETYRADMANVAEIWYNQKIYIEMFSKYEITANVQSVNDVLSNIKELIDLADPRILTDNLNKVMTDFSNNSMVLNKEWVQLKNKQTIDMLTIEKARRAVEDYTTEVQENERTRKNWEEDRIPEDIDPITE